MPRRASAACTSGCSSSGSASNCGSRAFCIAWRTSRSSARPASSSASQGSMSRTMATLLRWQPMSRLRCVFYDPDAVDAGSRLSERAFEACARADVEVFALAGDEVAVELGGELHDVTGEDGSIAFVMRALGLERDQAIGVGAALADAPVGAVWVGPLELDVRGPTVRVAEEGDELLYEAVISELAERRRA